MDEPNKRNALKRRNRELSILTEIAQALNAEVDLSRALNTTLEKTVELFDLQTGWIWLIREETDKPYLAAVRHLPPALTEKPERMDGTAYCYCLDSYQSGDMASAANISIITCTRLKNLHVGTQGLKSHATIPLFAHGKKLGILNVVSSDWQELSPADLKLLNAVGDLLSIAIERVRLFEKSTEIGAIEERNRLAREIHDTLAQGLSGIAYQLESADALLEIDQDVSKARQLVQQALQLTRQNLDEARRSVMDLRAAPLQERTLTEAINALLEENSRLNRFTYTFEQRDNPPLSMRTEMGLYRILQESLNNTIQHAQASHIYVRLSGTPDHIELIIEDNGIGFDTSGDHQECFGLMGINERAKLLGGTLQLSSEIGEGTIIKVTIPLEETHE